MAVYVDNFDAPYRGMIMCHMIADTRDELLAMADAIEVNRKWIQEFDTSREHFDVCLKKKKQAIKMGAIEISFMELGRMTKERTYEGRTWECKVVRMNPNAEDEANRKKLLQQILQRKSF